MNRFDNAPSNDLRRPMQVGSQLSLFPRGRDETLARARVSLDDVARWQEIGWLSFDAAMLETLEDDQTAELVFIRDVARSGLPNTLVTEMLGELERPYAYPSATTAYSFAHGWVEIAFPDMDEIIEQHLEEWAQERQINGEEEKLEAASDCLVFALASLRAGKKSKQ